MWGNYYNYGYGFWPGSLIGVLVQILIVVIFISLIMRFVRRSWRWGGPWNGMNGPDSAEQLLKERFVKGEISKEEYEEKLKVIRDNAPKR